MSKPKRIQRSRAKGWKMPANAIYVGRPTVWGNPYVVGSELMNGETLTAEKAVELYEQHLADNFSERDILTKHGLFAEGSRRGHFFDFDDGHLLLTGITGVKFANDSRTLS